MTTTTKMTLPALTLAAVALLGGALPAGAATPTPGSAAAGTGTTATAAVERAASCQRTLGTYPVLEPGDRGKAVRTLQCLLRDLGLEPGPVDGYYGARTRQAVREIENGFEGEPLDPGRIDNGFWTLLHARNIDVLVAPGDRGPQVRRLQRALRAAGGTLEVDGWYGARTRGVVRSYQRRHDLRVTGRVNDQVMFYLTQGGTLKDLS